MKDFRYANRGSALESFIEYANNSYKRKGIAVIEKQYVEMLPIRDGRGKVVACKVGEKSTVDYLGRIGNIPIAIEAKNTNEGSIRFDRIQQHQAQFLDDFTRDGAGLGFVLLSFNFKKFFLVPWNPFWQGAYNARVRPGASRTTPVSISAFGTTWDIPKKNSVRIDEIPAEFEVSGNDHTFGLHYLAKAEHYIMPSKQPKNQIK